MRKALIVGIDYYHRIGSLRGAVNDAHSVKSTLERNADGTSNFAQPLLLAGAGPATAVSRTKLRAAVQDLFRDSADIAVFYFAGHGYIDVAGGYLCASDSESGHDGLSLAEVVKFANDSPAKNRVIILDSCHSGIAGDSPSTPDMAEIKEGVTILTASAKDQYSEETNGCGIFTNLLVDALNGAASNLLGDVTPGSVYAHVDQSLGPWSQRPIFKTNVKAFVSLRKADPPIELEKLQQLVQLFANPADELSLDPSYEPDRRRTEDADVAPPDPERTADFAVLQALAKVNLVRPVGTTHMYYAAMESRCCRLTVLGQHYWSLVYGGLI